MEHNSASDLYITVGKPATLRGEEALITLSDNPLTEDDVNSILAAILTTRQRREYETEMELNTALDMGKHGRFRVNVLRQRQFPALVIRRITSIIPNFEQLKLPAIFGQLAMEKRGLVLITGMTGSGKSTTLASMIDYRNSREEGHIITIEDPIEYYHDHKKSVITQREVGVDTDSYAIAMKNSLRQRPDVILVGEIRDREVMEQALAIAETGHLCLATIHTNNSYQAIERIVNLFPEELSAQIRMNLAMNLKAIVSQRLIPGVEKKLVPAIEVMINQGFVRELIQKGDISKIREVMEQNVSSGMCSFDQCLIALYQAGRITSETAILNSDKPSEMKIKVQQADLVSSDAKSKNKDGVLAGLDTSIISLHD
ncbi:MAG: PilT/PilU family type 4a pilus ATPase [Alphaproteobacteria bacterium]|nr:PilT/PilU family type 4a pilus ATPase [Alphaproteobacteria bacterium]